MFTPTSAFFICENSLMTKHNFSNQKSRCSEQKRPSEVNVSSACTLALAQGGSKELKDHHF